jgi:DNA-binding NarL/FixJ family response regulator
MKKRSKDEREKAFGGRARQIRNDALGPDQLSGEAMIKPLTKVRVLIVHHACWFRRAMRSFIDGSGRFAVCAETDNARSAITLFEQHQPKIVLLGTTLVHGDALQLIKMVLKLAPAALILVLSSEESATAVWRVIRAGAMGYLVAEDGDLELSTALDTIAAGAYYVSKSLWNVVLKSLKYCTLRVPNSDTDMLTDRELEVFTLIGRGAGISEIAYDMGVSVKTIETHQMRIKQKLNLVNAVELRKYAMRMMSNHRRGR